MLINKEQNQIETICKRLRQQIESGKIKFIYSKNFSKGCCGNASQDFLLHRLKKAGFVNTVYVNGWCEKYKSHGWLEYKGYIIDITADQFPEIKEPIVIVKKEESEFHKQFA